MQLSWDEIYANAVTFSKRWEHGRSEKSEAQSFIRDFLVVFGVDDPAAVGKFENPAQRESGDGYMDYFWPKKIAIEMKSKGKDLKKAYEQLKEYVLHRPAEEMPDLLMVSDFDTIILYHRTTNKRKQFKTKKLRENIRYFSLLAGYETKREIEEQFEVNVKAAEKMAKLHEALKNSGYEGHELEVYLVRLLFCLFAEDTGIFARDCFLNYVQNSKDDGSNLSERIASLFEILNMSETARAKRTLLSVDLKEFQYINGGLFRDRLSPADFDVKMRQTLIECCKFDWSKISPAIFGAMFQGVMDKKTRRELGTHYTSEENILKLLKPLFLGELWEKFEQIKTDKNLLERFHKEIADLKFLDPACGCGNFLIIAYRELRKLEIEILKMKLGRTRQKRLDISSLLKVSVEQFYGIEIEDFPCEIARVGLWLMDHQMNLLVADEFGQYFARLPLTKGATIVHGNALRIDWESVVQKSELSYIFGNPPFVGNNNLTPSQRGDLAPLFPKNKTVDYVAAWYVKATEYTDGTSIRCAFVSTNSITQGEQVALLWGPLLERGVHINFGIPTFKWSNEAKGKAAVHCVIVGFSYQKTKPVISPYLTEGFEFVVVSRNKPLCDVPEIQKGNQPTDGGNLIIEADEYDDFIAKEPLAQKYIKRLIGAKEYIQNLPRYCLWLADASPADLRKMPLVLARVEKCRQMRLASPDAGTNRLAETPTVFRETCNPDTFIVIPSASSERRRYIPLGFLDDDTIATNLVLIIPNGTLYHFGILTSGVHMAWMRAICGRLKSDYRYSKEIVYNNFPWPEATEKQKGEIETLSQAVLDARRLYPDSSLADLYDARTLKEELVNAHRKLDRAVMKLYGFKSDWPESKIVAALMERYQELCKKKTS